MPDAKTSKREQGESRMCASGNRLCWSWDKSIQLYKQSIVLKYQHLKSFFLFQNVFLPSYFSHTVYIHNREKDPLTVIFARGNIHCVGSIRFSSPEHLRKQTLANWLRVCKEEAVYICSLLNPPTWSTLLSRAVISFSLTILSRIPGWLLHRPRTGPRFPHLVLTSDLAEAPNSLVLQDLRKYYQQRDRRLRKKVNKLPQRK